MGGVVETFSLQKSRPFLKDHLHCRCNKKMTVPRANVERPITTTGREVLWIGPTLLPRTLSGLLSYLTVTPKWRNVYAK